MENKNKLFVLLGKSGSGKSTIESAINKSGYADKIISTTTRSPRIPIEQDGIDYYFLPQEVFNAYLKQGQYAEHSYYTTVDGLASYGINKNDIRLKENNQICVVNPAGYSQLLNNLGQEKVIGIYIIRDDQERYISTLTRDKREFKTKKKEADRRLESDDVDFAGMETKAKYVVENKDLDQAIQDVIKVIEEETR